MPGQRDPEEGQRIFRGGGARPPVPQMIAFIDNHRGVFGVGLICRVLGVAPSTYYAFKAVERDPDLASDRARQDQLDMAAIKQAFGSIRGRYGARKVWHQLRRSGHDIARCTVERLMKIMTLQGVVRGKKVITTNPDTAQPCPADKVNRAFVADMPNRLWGRSLWCHWSEPNGRRFHLCLKLAGYGLCRLRDRRLRPQDRRPGRVGNTEVGRLV